MHSHQNLHEVYTRMILVVVRHAPALMVLEAVFVALGHAPALMVLEAVFVALGHAPALMAVEVVFVVVRYAPALMAVEAASGQDFHVALQPYLCHARTYF